MPATVDINAFIVAPSGVSKPFRLRISEPIKTAGEDEFSCLVHAPELFEGDKRIFGADRRQAQQLAVEFVRKLLSGARIVDQDGKEVQLSVTPSESGTSD